MKKLIKCGVLAILLGASLHSQAAERTWQVGAGLNLGGLAGKEDKTFADFGWGWNALARAFPAGFEKGRLGFGGAFMTHSHKGTGGAATAKFGESSLEVHYITGSGDDGEGFGEAYKYWTFGYANTKAQRDQFAEKYNGFVVGGGVASIPNNKGAKHAFAELKFFWSSKIPEEAGRLSLQLRGGWIY